MRSSPSYRRPGSDVAGFRPEISRTVRGNHIYRLQLNMDLGVRLVFFEQDRLLQHARNGMGSEKMRDGMGENFFIH